MARHGRTHNANKNRDDSRSSWAATVVTIKGEWNCLTETESTGQTNILLASSKDQLRSATSSILVLVISVISAGSYTMVYNR